MPAEGGETVDVGALDLVNIVKVLGEGGGWVALVWVLIGHNRRIMRGDLVPRQTHQDALDANKALQEQVRVQGESIRDMADSMSVVEQFVTALPRPGPADRRRGGR